MYKLILWSLVIVQNLAFSIFYIDKNEQMVVQGFYWKGQGEYTHDQRRSLVQLLPNGSVYMYLPQLVHTMVLWNATDLAQWKKTKYLCMQRGIKLIIGLRPMTIDNITVTLNKIQQKVSQLNLPYALGWDDCPGGQTQPQKRLQVELITKLSMKPQAVVPGAYYSQDGTMQTWLKGLSIISDIDESIAFILCSKNGINPSTFDPSNDFPSVNRRLIFWDNWMAVDGLTRLPRNLPRSRSPNLFNRANLGYILNLCFPPERIIHGISAISFLQKGQGYNYTSIAYNWTTYLLNQFFINRTQAIQMQSVLEQLLVQYNGTMSVKTLLKQYPILSTFLYE